MDSQVLERFCVAKSFYEDAVGRVNSSGTVVQSKHGPMHNPFVGVMNKQAAVMRQCSDELGLSPVARSRVKVGGKKSKGRSAFGHLKELKLD